jgi:hypothetical protein
MLGSTFSMPTTGMPLSTSSVFFSELPNDPVARLVGQVGFEPIRQSLIDEGISVRQEQNVLRLSGAEKDVNQGHSYVRLARAGGHYEECAALS